MNSIIGSVFNSGAFVSSWFHLDFFFFSLVKHACGWQMLPHCWTVGVFYSFILPHPVGDISTCHPSESTQMPRCLFITAFYSPCVLYKGKITSLRFNRSHLMALKLLLSQQMFTSMWSSQGPSWQSQPDPRSPSPSRSRNTREPGKLETWIEKRHNMKGGGRD